MMRSVLCLAVFFGALSGCATSSKTHTPDGKVGHSITCSGSALSWGTCYEKAGAICGTNGYDVVAGGAERGATVAANPYGMFGSTTMTRNMLVQCKA